MSDGQPTGQMALALTQLHDALQDLRLPLALPGVEEHRQSRVEMVDQLEDYVIPRVLSADAPLLAVVGGSTGAGKSTLVNSLVGTRVTQPGVLRPTTRSPGWRSSTPPTSTPSRSRTAPSQRSCSPPPTCGSS
jgi:hypothetical protein